MTKGYQDAITLGLEALSALEPETVVSRTSARFENGVYRVPWLSKMKELDAGSDIERILWLHYLTSHGTRDQTGRLMAFHEVRGASFYEPKFSARAIRPIIQKFGEEPRGLVRAAGAIGGRETTGGDAAVIVSAFPEIPITYLLWGGDETGGASGQILFDSSAPAWLPAEDLVVMASLVSYALVEAAA